MHLLVSYMGRFAPVWCTSSSYGHTVVISIMHITFVKKKTATLNKHFHPVVYARTCQIIAVMPWYSLTQYTTGRCRDGKIAEKEEEVCVLKQLAKKMSLMYTVWVQRKSVAVREIFATQQSGTIVTRYTLHALIANAPLAISDIHWIGGRSTKPYEEALWWHFAVHTRNAQYTISALVIINNIIFIFNAQCNSYRTD